MAKEPIRLAKVIPRLVKIIHATKLCQANLKVPYARFLTHSSPIPVNLWIQILPVTDHSSKMKLTMKAEVNPFIKAMVKKPLQEGIEKVADALQMIQYE